MTSETSGAKTELPVGETKEEPAEGQGTRLLLVLAQRGHSSDLRMLISSADSARVKASMWAWPERCLSCQSCLGIPAQLDLQEAEAVVVSGCPQEESV